ncbi:hypothetical protein [Macrococcoides caseolyticum]|nr:hypothetical protein [Macrococcus caseolyticus]
MDKQLYIPLKLEESTLKVFEDILKNIANKTIGKFYNQVSHLRCALKK